MEGEASIVRGQQRPAEAAQSGTARRSQQVTRLLDWLDWILGGEDRVEGCGDQQPATCKLHGGL